MAVNKVNYGNKTLIDLTSDTVTAENLIQGITAHNKSGDKITGTYKKPSGTVNISSNGTVNVASYASANVNIPSGFTNYTSGSFVGANQSSITLDSGSFTPKAVAICANNAMFNKSASTYYYGMLFCLWDNSGNIVCQKANFLSLQSTSQGARLGRTSSGFSRSGTSVSFANDNTFHFQSGLEYQYFIWG